MSTESNEAQELLRSYEVDVEAVFELNEQLVEQANASEGSISRARLGRDLRDMWDLFRPGLVRFRQEDPSGFDEFRRTRPYESRVKRAAR